MHPQADSSSSFHRTMTEKGQNQWPLSYLPHSTFLTFQERICLVRCFLAGLQGEGPSTWTHLVYDRFQLKISSRLEEGETSRFCRAPQRRRPPRNEVRRLLSPFILSSVRKNSVKVRKYSKMTSWLQAGKGSCRRKPQWPPRQLSKRKK